MVSVLLVQRQFSCFCYFSGPKVKDLNLFTFWLVGKLPYCSIAGTDPVRILVKGKEQWNVTAVKGQGQVHEVTFVWSLRVWNHSDYCRNYCKSEWNGLSFCFLFISGYIIERMVEIHKSTYKITKLNTMVR